MRSPQTFALALVAVASTVTGLRVPKAKSISNSPGGGASGSGPGGVIPLGLMPNENCVAGYNSDVASQTDVRYVATAANALPFMCRPLSESDGQLGVQAHSIACPGGDTSILRNCQDTLIMFSSPTQTREEWLKNLGASVAGCRPYRAVEHCRREDVTDPDLKARLARQEKGNNLASGVWTTLYISPRIWNLHKPVPVGRGWCAHPVPARYGANGQLLDPVGAPKGTTNNIGYHPGYYGCKRPGRLPTCPAGRFIEPGTHPKSLQDPGYCHGDL